MTTNTVSNITDATFAHDVPSHSEAEPIVVDFWAPWCGPCRMLSPLLEQLAEEYAGRVRMVKVNVDENPRVASQFGIQSTPAVFAFQSGQIANQFLGALPEPPLRAFFEALLPSEADRSPQKGGTGLRERRPRPRTDPIRGRAPDRRQPSRRSPRALRTARHG